MLSSSRLIHAFTQHFGVSPSALAIAPGRVNILGEHLDYNDGIVLPAAVNLYTTVAFAASPDGISRLEAIDFDQHVSFTLASLASKTDATERPLPEWALYPAGIARAIHLSNHKILPLNAVFTSEVPIGAGLSSSASVEMAFASAWSWLGEWTLPGIDFARLGQQAENQYVGVKSGIMDQFTSACGIKDHVLALDCRTLNARPLLWPADIDIIVADSTLRRKLTSSAYNDRRQSCQAAVEVFRELIPNVRALRDVTPQDFDQLGHLLDPMVRKRARHVIEEMERVRQGIKLLEIGDITGLGKLIYASHASLRDLYEVSTPELDALVDIAATLPGCLGARLTGAGFGGCTLNLVQQSASDDFVASLTDQYFERTGRHLVTYRCKLSAGPRIVKLG